MKSLTLICILLAIHLLSACAVKSKVYKAEKILNNVTVDSYVIMNNKILNDKISKMKGHKSSPLQLTLHALNIDANQKKIVIYQLFPSMENKESVFVTIIRDGYLDDSVRGEWNEIEMKKGVDEAWRIVKAKQAFRCWRSGRQNFQNRSCP